MRPHEKDRISVESLRKLSRKSMLLDQFSYLEFSDSKKTSDFLADSHRRLQSQFQPNLSYSTFCQLAAKTRELTVEQVLGLGLRRFPSLGYDGVELILAKIGKTWSEIRRHLKRIEKNEFRINLKESGKLTRLPMTSTFVDRLYRLFQ